MNVLKHMLKRRGLRQSPCNTPRPTVIKGVRNSEVIIEVWKSVYNMTFYNKFYMIRDMVVVKYGLDEVVMDFAEGILKIK